MGCQSRFPRATKIAILCITLLTAGVLHGQDPGTKTVVVKLAADRSIENIVEWKIAASRLLGDVFRTFRERFDIRLSLGDIVTWNTRGGRRPLSEVLGELRKRVPPGKCDIVLGVVAPERTSSVSLGIASYPFGYILVKNLASREAMVYALLHEICHMFGAIDLKEKGSIMGIEAPGFEIDAFTARAVRLHRDRMFGGPAYPLSKESLAEAAALFKERAGLGLEEPEVHVVLALLYTEMNELDFAALACAEAVSEEPGFPGLYVLLGNICLKKGAPDQALEQYRRALGLQPGEAGIHFNLGLALADLGKLAEARTEFDLALKLNPRYIEARQASDQVRRAGPLSARLNLKFEPIGIATRGVK